MAAIQEAERTRRGFFTDALSYTSNAAAVVVPGAVIGGVVYSQLAPELAAIGMIQDRAKEFGVDEDPVKFYVGEVEIRKGVNIRLSPEFPKDLNGNTLDNTVPWNLISAVHGQPIGGQVAFKVKNPRVVYGSDPRVHDRNTDATVGFGEWIKLHAQLQAGFGLYRQAVNLYVNLGSYTAGLVKPLSPGRFVEVEKNENGVLISKRTGLALPPCTVKI